MSKWKKHKGIIEVKMGEDIFNMKLENEQLPRFFRIANAMNRGGMDAGVNKEMLSLCKDALKVGNPNDKELTNEVLDMFVKDNGFKLVMALMKVLGE